LIVVDASAVMALMLAEPGADVVTAQIRGSLISAINLSECCARGVERGADAADVLSIVRGYEVQVIPFDLAAALATADLRESTRPFGSSLGDRACLALGLSRSAAVFTSDRRMAAAGQKLCIDIRLIR
jgi:ribonuclease VapC